MKNSSPEKIAKKLDFNISSFSDKANKENVRISNDLIKNENMFTSHVFKSEYMKIDKLTGSYYVETDADVLKVFSQITKLIKINNTFNINSITDFYILQLMILENDFKICYAQRDKSQSDLKSKSESLIAKEDEIKFLRERVKYYENQDNSEKQMEVIQREVNGIRDKLLTKTHELSKFEDLHNKILEKNKIKVNEINDMHQSLVEENLKIKSIILDLVSAYKKGSEPELKTVLMYLVENTAEFEEKTTILNNFNKNKNLDANANANSNVNNKDKNNSDKQILLSDNNRSSLDNSFNEDGVKLLTEDTHEERFTQKVIDEFDKVLNDEFKKVQRFFKKDGDLKRKSSLNMSTSMNEGRKLSSGKKNYVEWIAKTAHGSWLDSLRGGNEKEEKKKIDVHDLVINSKLKIRESIRNLNNLTKGTGSVSPVKSIRNTEDSTFIKISPDYNNNNENLSKIYEDKFGKSHSPIFRDLNARKIGKRENENRE